MGRYPDKRCTSQQPAYSLEPVALNLDPLHCDCLKLKHHVCATAMRPGATVGLALPYRDRGLGRRDRARRQAPRQRAIRLEGRWVERFLEISLPFALPPKTKPLSALYYGIPSSSYGIVLNPPAKRAKDYGLRVAGVIALARRDGPILRQRFETPTSTIERRYAGSTPALGSTARSNFPLASPLIPHSIRVTAAPRRGTERWSSGLKAGAPTPVKDTRPRSLCACG